MTNATQSSNQRGEFTQEELAALDSWDVERLLRRNSGDADFYWRVREAVLNRAADEIEQLRDLLRECLHAWEGSGPAIVLDRIRAVTQEPPK